MTETDSLKELAKKSAGGQRQRAYEAAEVQFTVLVMKPFSRTSWDHYPGYPQGIANEDMIDTIALQ